MSKNEATLPRPRKRGEYEIICATRDCAEELARPGSHYPGTGRRRLGLPDQDPTAESGTNHRLKGELATVTHAGQAFERWQYELPGGARLWFYIAGTTVCLTEVHTHHPNATKTSR